MPIKVAIVDDDTRLRESLSIVISGAENFRCIGAYANAEAALKQIPLAWPDVILMDINLPEMSGIECVAKLKEIRPSLLVIMLTVYSDEEKIFNSLRMGASGYLLKKTPPAEVLEAIADVRRGGSPMSYNIARQVVRYFQQQQQQRTTDDAANLSKREFEILTYLAKGYQYKEIAETLSISVATVRTHLRSIYDKLHVRSRTEAVVKFLGNRAI